MVGEDHVRRIPSASQLTLGSNILTCSPYYIWDHLEYCVNSWKITLSVSW